MSDSEIPQETDDKTFSMFGDEEMGAPEGYQVLARKYRPRLFEDLIGQEAMVRTLSNAFLTGRVAHAFMLTGVRGVGKTTTARLLARALNYVRDGADGPSIKLSPPGDHCEAIMASRHPDVLELDAASRTGVADMRDLLDSARYSPVSARYKVYIIDEVHMLSTAAFNALLKTLEEPPAHVKFIFATTEIRKVPITVLSRCQRFDLKRLETGALADHLGLISQKENAKVSEEGLSLIARAAEGSVRDGLSILDQAIVQSVEGEEVSGAVVRDMLGLGDRTRLMDVFEHAIKGNGKAAIAEISDQVHAGADPLIIAKDLLDICADVAVAQSTGDDYQPGGPADWVQRTKAMSQSLTPAQSARYWQLLLSGYGNLQGAPDMATALRMVVLRLSVAATLPSPEEAARLMIEGASRPPGKSEATSTPQVAGAGELLSFEDFVACLERRREVKLQLEVETYIRPGIFVPGRFVCQLETEAPSNLLRRVKALLEDETDLEWTVEQAVADAETIREGEIRTREEKFASAAAHPDVAEALRDLPGAKIIEVHDAAEGIEANDYPANVIGLDTRRKA